MAGRKPGTPKTGGRQKGTTNKATASIKELARQHTEAAMKCLVTVLAGGEGVPAAAQVAAAKEILDRGYGKAATIVAGDPEGAPIKTESDVKLDTSGLTDEQLRALASIRVSGE